MSSKLKLNPYFLTKYAIILFFLSSLATSSLGFKLQRIKRGTVKIGDLPKIKPPSILKNGEQKYPDPGWTHCIKYLTADSRWRSIRNINLNKLQATQFQCSWFISTDVPGNQIRLSFEKVDFGSKPGMTCTQQFMELIDIKTGKSQARMCGNKKYGDYVSVGQRVRIDVQGEEPLVSLLRTKQEPIVISFRTVKEPAGFRIGGTVKGTSGETAKNPGLKSSVRTPVGPVLRSDGRKNIYGKKNQPRANDPQDNDESNGSRASLTIWQVIIIIFISIAIVSCIIGVVIKRMVFDKRKKEEYLRFESLNAESEIKDKNLPNADLLQSPTSSSTSDNKKMKDCDNTWTEKEIPRSSSKPEPKLEKTNKKKRHNSLGDVTTNAKSQSQGDQNITENPKTKSEIIHAYTNVTIKRPEDQENPSNLPGLLPIVDDTPSSRAPRRPKPIAEKAKPKKSHRSSNGLAKKQHKTVESKKEAVKRDEFRKKSSDPSRKRAKHRRHNERAGKETISDEKAILAPKASEKVPNPLSRGEHSHLKGPKATEKSSKVDTPLSRAQNPKKNELKDTKASEKKTTNDTPLSRADNSPAKQFRSKKQSDVTENSKNRVKSDRHGRAHKKRDVLNNGTKRPKTVSSAHKKKSTATNGKRNNSRQRNSSQRKKEHETDSQENKTERNHRKKQDQRPEKTSV